MAMLRCVQEAFCRFTPKFFQNSRLHSEAIRGVWGFIPFAAEFWAVELQEWTPGPTQDWHPQLESIARKLSAQLATLQHGPDTHKFSGVPNYELQRIRSSFDGLLWYDFALNLHARNSPQARNLASDPGGKRAAPYLITGGVEHKEAG